jgi:hypothetical protein
MKFEVGDLVYCHTDVIMIEGGNRTVTAGCKYKIIGKPSLDFGGVDKFYIVSDDGLMHSFRYHDAHRWFEMGIKPIKHIKKFSLDGEEG